MFGWILLLAFSSFANSAAELASYFPGKFLDWKTYETLGRNAAIAWQTNRNVEQTFSKLNAAIEKEALLAMLSLLKDANTSVFLGGFSKPEEDRDETKDGLTGLRVVRQKQIGQRLLSSIETYDYDLTDKTFSLRTGPDVIRIRIEIAPFVKATDFNSKSAGIAGFSWLAKKGKIYSEPYVTDAPAGYSHGHGKLKFKDVTPCGFANHCNTCHHRFVRSIFPETYAKRKPEQMAGYKAFARFLNQNTKLSEKEIQEALQKLKDVSNTFHPKQLVSAFEGRWKETQK